MRTRHRGNGQEEPLHYHVCRKVHAREGCDAKKHHRAEQLEREIVALVDGELLADRETLERWIDEELGREQSRRAARDPALQQATCAKALEEVAMERDRYNRLYARGKLSDGEYDRYAGELKERETEARAELERARKAAERVRDLEANRRAILGAYGTGLQLGLWWFPPYLRRQVYAALGLVAWVSPDGPVCIEGSFDADVIQLTREVEEYARALMEVDERTRSAPPDVVERELSRVRDAHTAGR